MKRLLLPALLLTAMPAVAGDWTPLLKGLKQDCNYGEEIYQLLNKEKNIPKNLKADVIKHDTIYKRYDNDKVVSKNIATSMKLPVIVKQL